MRLVLLSRAAYPYHPFGGMEQAVFSTASALAHLGHEVELLTATPLPGWEEQIPDFGEWPPPFKVHFFPYRLFALGPRNSIPDRLANYPLFALRLGRTLLKITPKPELIYCQGLSGFGYALSTARNNKLAPLVMNPQGMEELKVKEFSKRLAYAPFNQLLRYTAKYSTAVIATDTPQIKEARELLRVPETKVTMVPNAVNLERIDNLTSKGAVQEIRNRFNPEGKFLIVSAGRLEANKGLAVGLEAFAQSKVAEEGKWIIVGKGTQRQVLEAHAQKLGLFPHKVFFAGNLSDRDLHALFESADLFLHPTLYEGSSLVTLEAMAHNLPVIASEAGGLPDKIKSVGPLANGRLCPPGDVSAFAAAITELAALSPVQRMEMGRASRECVERAYTWNKVGVQLSDLFEKLVVNKYDKI